jgi:putative SOS response-associated peptidase YedK
VHAQALTEGKLVPMCYSSQIAAAYQQYLKLTGATIDLDQFRELYGFRHSDSSIRIAPAVDRWFDEPKNADERAIKDFIDRHRAEAVASIEGEIFVQRKRLADAERKLQTKPTKAAGESRRIAGAKIEAALTRLSRLKSTQLHPDDARIFPMHHAPIVVQDGERRVVRLARYHCRQAGKPAGVDRTYPGLYNARRDNLEKFWRREFGHNHALMLVESFYENVDRNGRNAVLHFVPRPAGTMLVACLYAQWVDPAGGPPLLSFAAITDDPPVEVTAAGHDRMIVNLKPEHVAAWLTPAGRSPQELHGILSDRESPYYEHEVLAA